MRKRKSSDIRAAFSFFLGDGMDKLYECAKGFKKLLSKRYHIIIGRKGKAAELNIQFEDVEFHHLIGLHKLKDLRIARENRGRVFADILSRKIVLSDIEKSRYYDKIKDRLEPFIKIELLLDENNLVFRYNERKQTFSVIEAEYLLSSPYENTDVYIFLDRKEGEKEFFCRSFFPKRGKDYTAGQAVYTLLLKEKIDINTGESQLQYNRLISKERGTI